MDEDAGEVTLPYEFLPLPQAGDKGLALGCDGREVCDAEIVAVKTAGAFDKTNLLTMRVPEQYAMTTRFFKRSG